MHLSLDFTLDRPQENGYYYWLQAGANCWYSGLAIITDGFGWPCQDGKSRHVSTPDGPEDSKGLPPIWWAGPIKMGALR